MMKFNFKAASNVTTTTGPTTTTTRASSTSKLAFQLISFLIIFHFYIWIKATKQPIWWNEVSNGAWAYYCDFANRALANAQTSDTLACHSKCNSTTNCTHYTWIATTGTCYMKYGQVSKADAFYTSNNQYGCGLLYQTSKNLGLLKTFNCLEPFSSKLLRQQTWAMLLMLSLATQSLETSIQLLQMRFILISIRKRRQKEA